MNAAMAVHKHYVYIGSRTDAKNNNANHAGIMVVDVKRPDDRKPRSSTSSRASRASRRASCVSGARRRS